MKTTFNADETMTITCSVNDLILMESQKVALYGTPDLEDRIVSVYMSSQAHFVYDLVVATWEDFCDAEGWDNLGWQAWSQEELDACGEDETTIIVPRNTQELRGARDA